MLWFLEKKFPTLYRPCFDKTLWIFDKKCIQKNCENVDVYLTKFNWDDNQINNQFNFLKWSPKIDNAKRVELRH